MNDKDLVEQLKMASFIAYSDIKADKRQLHGNVNIVVNLKTAIAIVCQTQLKQKIQAILDEYGPKFTRKCKAGPPSDYQDLWFLTKEFRTKLEECIRNG